MEHRNRRRETPPRESLPQPTVDFRFGEAGVASQELRDAQLPGELAHLAGQFEFPLGAHRPKPTDLELPDFRIDPFHRRNLMDADPG